MGRKEEAFGKMKGFGNEMQGKMGGQRKSTGCLDFAGFQSLTLRNAGQVVMEKMVLIQVVVQFCS